MAALVTSSKPFWFIVVACFCCACRTSKSVPFKEHEVAITPPASSEEKTQEVIPSQTINITQQDEQHLVNIDQQTLALDLSFPNLTCAASSLSVSHLSATHSAIVGTATCNPTQEKAWLAFFVQTSAPPSVLRRWAWIEQAMSYVPVLSEVPATNEGDTVVRLDVTVDALSKNKKPNVLSLTWKKAGSTFHQDATEPLASIQKRVGAAEAAIKRSQWSDASSFSAAALQIYRDFCQESGEAKLWIGSQRGLMCRNTALVARALNANVQASIQNGRLMDALSQVAVWRSLLSTQEFNALSELIKAHAIHPTLQLGPALPASTGKGSRAAFMFVNDTVLAIRGSKLLYDVVSAHVTEGQPAPSSRTLLSDDGVWTFAGFQRNCLGYHVKLYRMINNAPVTNAWLIERRAGPREKCLRTSNWSSNESGDWVALGWHASEFWLTKNGVLVACSTHGQLRTLEQGTTLPPIKSDTVSKTGSRYLYPSPFGMVLIEQSTHAARLFDVGAYDKQQGIALSPTGGRIAFARGGSIYWFSTEIGNAP